MINCFSTLGVWPKTWIWLMRFVPGCQGRTLIGHWWNILLSKWLTVTTIRGGVRQIYWLNRRSPSNGLWVTLLLFCDRWRPLQVDGRVTPTTLVLHADREVLEDPPAVSGHHHICPSCEFMQLILWTTPETTNTPHHTTEHFNSRTGRDFSFDDMLFVYDSEYQVSVKHSSYVYFCK